MSTVVINGQQWELGDTIGTGGYGSVHVATSDSEQQVIKLVPKVDGAMRELRVATEVTGVSNVIPILGTAKTDTHLALLMPRAELSLRQYMEQTKRSTSEADALPILINIARALDALAQVRTREGVGVVHRDLKPENVLLLADSWCLTDFGIARYATKTTSADTRRYFMTHDYAAPEQWRGETATVATDVYAFGIIAFELLMGQRPFKAPDLREQHLRADVPSMTGLAPPLAALIEECLYKESSVRPNPVDLLRRLERQQQAAPVGGGLGALQQANLAETTRRSQIVQQQLKNQTRVERVEELTKIASRQAKQIGEQLRDNILSHAPRCAPIETTEPGWQLRLGGAILRFFDATAIDRTHAPSNSPRMHLSVLAACAVAVRVSGVASYAGRAHSLWFCDAEVEDRYGWYETAFVTAGGPGSRRAYFRDLEDADLSGEYAPFALGPHQREAVAALERWGGHEVAWPFTPLSVGELDVFIDRWATWFAEASQGQLRRPSKSRTLDALGSWRKPQPTKSVPDATVTAPIGSWGTGMLAVLAERVREVRDLVPSPDGLPQTHQADWFADAIATEHELKVARRHATRSFDAALEDARRAGRTDAANELAARSRAVLQTIGRRSNELREEERARRAVAELVARTQTLIGQEDFEVVGDGLPTEAQVRALATAAQSEDELNVVREFVRRRASEGHQEAIRRTRAGASDEGARMQQHIIETEPRLIALLDERAQTESWSATSQ